MNASPGRLRLVAITDSDHWGGAEVVLLRVLQHLSQTWDLTLLATEHKVAERFAAELPDLTVELVVPARSRHERRAVLRQLRATRGLGADVALVNLAHPWASPFLTAGAHLLARIPVLALEHLPLPTTSGFDLRVKGWNSRRLAAHLCVGEQASRRLERFAALPVGSIATVRNGVPWVTADPLPLPEGLTRPCLTWVGRLVHQKGVDVLLRALALVPGASLWLDGEGTQRVELEELATELGVVDRVRFTGWGPDPRGVLASADLVALPGRQEAWGLVLVEALQGGLPIIATDLPENEELLQDAALRFPLDDHVALAARIRETLADPAQLERMRAASLRVARSLPTVEEMTHSYDVLLREAVHRGRGVRLPDDVLCSVPAAPGASGAARADG